MIWLADIDRLVHDSPREQSVTELGPKGTTRRPVPFFSRRLFTPSEGVTPGGLSRFSPTWKRPCWRSEMQRSGKGVFLALDNDESEARGCERLERESWVSDFSSTVWPTRSSRSLCDVPGREAKRSGSIPVYFFTRERGLSGGVLRFSRSPTTRFTPSEDRT